MSSNGIRRSVFSGQEVVLDCHSVKVVKLCVTVLKHKGIGVLVFHPEANRACC